MAMITNTGRFSNNNEEHVLLDTNLRSRISFMCLSKTMLFHHLLWLLLFCLERMLMVKFIGGIIEEKPSRNYTRNLIK